MMEWEEHKLEKVIEQFIDYRGKTPKKTNHGVPLITAKIVKNGSILQPTEFISEEDYPKWMIRGFPEVGDVVLTTEAPLGEVAQIKDNNVALAQRIITLRGKKGILDNGFLKYYFQSNFGQHKLREKETGTTVTGIKQSELRKIHIPIPDLPTQQAIAEILSSLDDKIELNNRINQNLEELARTLFKRWFVDFEFPNENGEPYQSSGGEMAESELGMIPKGWEITRLDDHVNVERGLSYKGKGLTDKDGGIPMHNLNSIYEGSGYKYEGIKYYNGEYKERHIVNPWDIIVSNTEQGHKYLLIGYPAVVPKYFGNLGIFSQHIYKVTSKNESYLTHQFLYYLLITPLMREQVIGCTNGTTVNMLSKDGLQNPKFICPNIDLVKNFTELIYPIWGKSELIYVENQSLISMRDSLLPKLMSGKLTIQEAEQETSNVL